MTLSIPTLMVTIIIASLVSAAAIAAVAFRRNRELLIWSGALVVHATAYFLFVLRGQISDVLSIVVANIAVATTFALFGEGLFSFLRRPPPRWLIWLPVPITALVFTYFLDSLATRIILGGSIFAAQGMYVAYAIQQHRNAISGRGKYILMTGFLLISLIFVIRTISAAIGQTEAFSALAEGGVQTATFLSSITSLMLLATGLILMTQERAELALAHHRDHLEDLVASRTHELEIAKDAAEAANRAKSTFLANMSHELRTPMNAIMGMTAIALRSTDNPKLRDQLGKVDQASHHLLAIINDILDLSKIEADRMTLEQVEFRLSDVLDNLTTLTRTRALEKGLLLRIDLPADLQNSIFTGDPTRLGQVLLNLVGNAIKFTPQGSVEVRIEVGETLPPDPVLLRFFVTDSGIGIAGEDQKRLFTSFEQADNSTTRKYGGTGLGLAISKRLVSMMGGEIGVNSQPGQGSTFWFSVRLNRKTIKPQAAIQVTTQAAPSQSNESAEVRLQRAHANARILLAEDEPINREILLCILQDIGLQADIAEDGLQALEQARATRYDLILMDIQMPGMNGIEVTHAIRADSVNRDTPIIAITANAFDEDRESCLAAGMHDHLGKPVDPEQLYEALLRWLAPPGR
jgi:signal transduction histidine kinase/ActR/RegA family two-component response regulator